MGDWNTEQTFIGSRVGGGGSQPRAKVARSEAQINAARRTGGVLAVEKKYTTGNKVGDTDGQRLTKVDRGDEIIAPPKVDISVGKAIQKGRQDKGMTQKDLAVKINEKPQVINDYESGRAIPNQQILGKMERNLGIKLRGKDIGQPLGGPKKK
ncbi:putative multi-protein binding factor 1 [Nadsonia fulvescens var. elongata DSM 6958]|uniref:Putative multi-protein binding factor 1 n=1 Tax=Nadsonia fulvescens var. elongata DSM 6958 TaxID=857566 RepID=A0A1E3PPA2_9ASCO|nr:putative multi-protein binding factor 1 [Nadsonia fulvescens var. elongata DSM 6958]